MKNSDLYFCWPMMVTQKWSRRTAKQYWVTLTRVLMIGSLPSDLSHITLASIQWLFLHVAPALFTGLTTNRRSPNKVLTGSRETDWAGQGRAGLVPRVLTCLPGPGLGWLSAARANQVNWWSRKQPGRKYLKCTIFYLHFTLYIISLTYLLDHNYVLCAPILLTCW